MVIFFESKLKNIFAVQSDEDFSNEQISKLEWLFGKSKFLSKNQIKNNRRTIMTGSRMILKKNFNLLYLSPLRKEDRLFLNHWLIRVNFERKVINFQKTIIIYIFFYNLLFIF